MRSSRLPLATRAAILYTLIGCAWIVLSDRIAQAPFPDPAQLTIAQTYKGWLFVLGSALVLLVYIGRESRIRRDAQKEFASVFGQALEGIYHSALDGKYLKVNPALARMYGYTSPEELLLTVAD